MSVEIIVFDNIELEKPKFHNHKNLNLLEKVV